MFRWVEPFGPKMLFAALAVAAWALVAAPPASAVTFGACSEAAASAVSPNAGCTLVLDAVNDSAGVMNTAPGAFGFTTWRFIGRDNNEPEAGDIDIWATGDWVSGTFSFDPGLVAGFSGVALVLKSAASADPCSVIAYLLEPGQTSG